MRLASAVTPDLPPAALELLHRLLDRFERPNRRTVVRVRLEEIKAYAASSRADVHSVLNALAARNILRLHWVKHEENNWLEAVDLIPEQAIGLYSLLQRTQRATREEALRNLLSAQQPRSDWQAAFLEWAARQLDRHQSVAPLDLDDPQTNADLLQALTAIAGLQAPILERVLSVQVFGDSKRLEALRGKVILVLRRFNAAKAVLIDDDDALLRANLLERTPEYVPCAGLLVLRVEDSEIDLSRFRPSLALSAAMLRQASVLSVPAQHVITIENATSFTEAIAVRSEKAFLLYTSGFASPTVIQFLQTMRAMAPATQFWHWGDLDVGGLRILAHLRQFVEVIRPLGMDALTFENHRAYARPLKKGERESLRALQSMSLLGDCVPLMELMLTAGQKLEQEAIRSSEVLQSLNSK
jgi:hypothetical protein